MKAVLLVGGLGTRLRPLTFSIPKPLLPIGEVPIVQIIIEQLRDAGIRDIILATGYQAELIQAFCGDGARFGVNVTYVKEERPLGTAGPLSLMRDRFDPDEYFILMNGDILTKLDFRAFLAFGAAHKWELTIGYTTYTYRSPFGVLTVTENVVEDVVEKPSREYLISAGVYCLKGTALRWIPDGQFFTVPDLMRRFAAEHKPVGAYLITDAWLGLESVAHFEEALRVLEGASIKSFRGPSNGGSGRLEQ